jgi:hypothetical protein
MGDDLRSLALADDKFGVSIIEFNGGRFEVRPPTLAQQRRFSKQAVLKGEKEPDGARLTVLAVIGCTYYPGTEDRVFEAADVEVLENKSTDPRTFVGKVARVIRESMSASMEEAAENFDETPS